MMKRFNGHPEVDVLIEVAIGAFLGLIVFILVY